MALVLTVQVLVIVEPSWASTCVGDLTAAGIEAKQGQGETDDWNLDGPFHAKRAYEKAFAKILKKTGVPVAWNFFELIILKLKLTTGKVHVMDLFGSGFFVQNRFATDSITGVRWGHYEAKGWNRKLFDRPAPPEVLGDIFNPETWSKLDESMRERDIPAMDLVTMRPVGGWWDIVKKSPDAQIVALKYVIENVKARLSPDGRFYFTVCQDGRGGLSQHPELQDFAKKIYAETPYELILADTPSSVPNALIDLSGVLLPKNR